MIKAIGWGHGLPSLVPAHTVASLLLSCPQLAHLEAFTGSSRLMRAMLGT